MRIVGGGGQSNVATLGDLSGAPPLPPLIFDTYPLFLVLNGMTLEGQLREISDKISEWAKFFQGRRNFANFAPWSQSRGLPLPAPAILGVSIDKLVCLWGVQLCGGA